MQPRNNGKFGSIPLEERFWAKVDRTDDCWLWTGAKNNYGYGLIMYKGVSTGAHRVSYIIDNGNLSEGLEVDHLCRNQLCVRPEHLEAVTHRENIKRTIPFRKKRRTRIKLTKELGDSNG